MFKLSGFSVSDSNSANEFLFVNALKIKWDKIHNETSVFRYKINSLKEKLVDGYLLQLNPDRNVKRRTPEHIDSICQPFNKEKFNFTKVSQQEIIFSIRGNDYDDADLHNIIVNVSPITRYHSLLCPSVNSCLPQIVTLASLKLAIKFMFLSRDRSLRIGFNSLCALASVNHLHYHIFIEENTLPVETVKCKHLSGPIYYLSEDYPCSAFCFEAASENFNISRDIFKLVDYFIKNSIAHNIFMTRGQSLSSSNGEVLRVLVWPRKSSAGVKQSSDFNIAVCELSGWFPVYNLEHYENLRRVHLDNELKKWNLDNFEQLCNEIKFLF